MGSSNQTNVDWHLPRNSWDTHVHVFNPAQYPYATSRAYSPEIATYESLQKFNAKLTAANATQNLVLVQPSPYDTDNALILDLLRNHAENGQNANRKLRAITVFDPDEVTDEQLEQWNELGVRGFRINTEASSRVKDYDAMKVRIVRTAERVKAYKHWKCQLYISGDDWDHLSDTISQLPCQVIADHQGGMKGSSALLSGTTSVTSQPGFASLLALAKSGKVLVKISALYRSSKLTTGGYDDLEPLIRTFAEQIPNQLIWASDWPHTGSGANRTKENREVPEKFRQIDNVAVLKNLRQWAGPDVWWRMTVQTPERIYM